MKRFTIFNIFVYCLAVLSSLMLAGCRSEGHYPDRPIVLICPWAAGGGTDRVSRQLAALLEQDLGVPVNVVNATGGGGVTGHTRGALARPDGYTLTMMTVEINMLHWQGLTSLSYTDFEPVALINRDAAALFVRDNAPWQSPEDLKAHIQRQPGQLKASGTARGGIWHVAFAGWLDAMGLNPSVATWVPINGAAPSLQELIAEGVDVVCCSLPEAKALLDAGRVRCLGVMAEERVPQFPDVPTFREQGDDWSIAGWRGIGLPLGTPRSVIATVVESLERVIQSTEFQRFMDSSGFQVTFEPPEEFSDSLEQADVQLGEILGSPAFREEVPHRLGPRTFPALLAGLLLAALVVLILSGELGRDPEAQPITRMQWLRLAEVVAWVVVYVVIVEWVGFVLTSGALLALWLWRLGNRPAVAVIIAAIAVPLAYQVFAVSLRVPLPRGIFGW